jgi:hypothetical protein
LFAETRSEAALVGGLFPQRWPRHGDPAYLGINVRRINGGGNIELPRKTAQRQVFFPKWLLPGFPRLCAALYAETFLTRFFSAFAFLFSLLLF